MCIPNEGGIKMEKTYTISITYETTITTTASQEDIENALWVGDQEIGQIANARGTLILADAVDYEVQEE